MFAIDDFASWDNPVNWWPSLIDCVLDPIHHCARTLSYPQSQWSREETRDAVRDQPVKPVMILEGVSSARREFRSYLTYAIWVDTHRRSLQTL